MNMDLAMCAQINFENLEKALPLVKKHAYYIIAKAQLDEALGGKTVEKTFMRAIQDKSTPNSQET